MWISLCVYIYIYIYKYILHGILIYERDHFLSTLQADELDRITGSHRQALEWRSILVFSMQPFALLTGCTILFANHGANTASGPEVSPSAGRSAPWGSIWQQVDTVRCAAVHTTVHNNDTQWCKRCNTTQVSDAQCTQQPEPSLPRIFECRFSQHVWYTYQSGCVTMVSSAHQASHARRGFLS